MVGWYIVVCFRNYNNRCESLVIMLGFHEKEGEGDVSCVCCHNVPLPFAQYYRLTNFLLLVIFDTNLNKLGKKKRLEMLSSCIMGIVG